MTHCPKCRKVDFYDGKFCVECGTENKPDGPPCPNGHPQSSKYNKYCQECGEKVLSRPAQG